VVDRLATAGVRVAVGGAWSPVSPGESGITSSPLVLGHPVLARFFRSGLLGVALLLIVDIVGGLLGLLGLPCARGPKVDWEAVLWLHNVCVFRLSEEWGVMDVQCVLVTGGVGFSCGAPMALPAFAGESDGEDDMMGIDACWGRMASRSVIVEGVGAVVCSACGRPTASRSETAEGVGAIAAGVVGGLMASRSETAEGAGAIVIGSGGAVMASRSETADGEAVLGGMAGSADECSGGTTAVAGWAGA
jgi:hypothetical protein